MASCESLPVQVAKVPAAPRTDQLHPLLLHPLLLHLLHDFNDLMYCLFGLATW